MIDSRRLPIFPLEGVILLPGMHLPLHVFEPRYRAMVSQVLATDRVIGLVQPRAPELPGYARTPIYDVGGLGRIVDVEALEDGRFNIVLEGTNLFQVTAEADVTTAFRQVEADILPVTEEEEPLAPATRAALEQEARRFAVWLGYRVDWDGVGQLDDVTFVNAIAQIAPFDAAAKQGLLEAGTVGERAELEMQLMRFMTSRPESGDDRVTLQ